LSKLKKPIVKPRRAEPEVPEIYVKTVDGTRFGYARAHIRVKSDQYNYLVWRDGERILNFYLGKKKHS
jgi:hypothetical protein